jgi:ubiquinone/menaquinone biosynthesis C-methylase UbiE
MQETPYIIRGGMEGRERLRLLARVLRPTTLALLDRAGVRAGMRCLDAGCGGGDVTLDLAALVGPGGMVVGIDIDAAKLELARREPADRQVGHVEFRQAGVPAADLGAGFDVAYVRFR